MEDDIIHDSDSLCSINPHSDRVIEPTAGTVFTTPTRTRELTGRDIPTAESYERNFIALLKTEESATESIYGYMEKQADIDSDSRATVVDWMCGVLRTWKSDSTCLFLAVSILDRYLRSTAVSRSRLQLAGIAALWVGFKIVEGDDITALECLRSCPSLFTPAQLLRMEADICRALSFRLSSITADCFVEKFCRDSADLLPLAMYLAELSLVDYTFLAYQHSEVAAAAVNIAARTIRSAEAWTPEWVTTTGCAACDIASVITRIEQLHAATADPTICRYMKAKYSSREFNRVATVPIAKFAST